MIEMSPALQRASWRALARSRRRSAVGRPWLMLRHPALPTCAVLYILWAYIPNSVLESYGIYYYPSKYWAVALPTWVCVTVVAVYWAYEGCACSMLGIGSGVSWALVVKVGEKERH